MSVRDHVYRRGQKSLSSLCVTIPVPKDANFTTSWRKHVITFTLSDWYLFYDMLDDLTVAILAKLDVLDYFILQNWWEKQQETKMALLEI